MNLKLIILVAVLAAFGGQDATAQIVDRGRIESAMRACGAANKGSVIVYALAKFGDGWKLEAVDVPECSPMGPRNRARLKGFNLEFDGHDALMTYLVRLEGTVGAKGVLERHGG